MFTKEEKHTCLDNCNYFSSNNICDVDCSFSSENIILDKENEQDPNVCVNKCDENPDFKFLTIIDNQLHCSKSCLNDPNNKGHLKNNYECIWR